ncbi:MAG: type II toxin-antitoxin system PemK/MazF family toxin [Acidobacteria bacterium]|nr:type II toxin-antitoxin system PemK/MazF family toxin [Acidobacteriota bacterium]MCG3194875.1 Endoribonuclease EndoA [Thermoanaerobaculia bacterium]
MKRGDVFWANVEPRSGSEQRGTRPVIVVSHDAFNRTPGWRSVIVVPISTSERQARRGPTAIGLAAGCGGLREPSVVLCHQVTTLDRSKLTELIGSVGGEDLASVDGGLKAAMALD